MKKVLIVLMTLLIITGCSAKPEPYPQPQGQVADMSGYGLEDSQQFYDMSVEELVNTVKNGGTAIVLVGYETCNWCNALVPVLDEVSRQKQMKLYYLNYMRKSNFDNKEFWDVVDLIAQEGYITEKDEDGMPVFYFPSIIYIYKGKIVNFHWGTVSGHDADSKPLTEKQRARLVYQLEKEFDSLLNAGL